MGQMTHVMAVVLFATMLTASSFSDPDPYKHTCKNMTRFACEDTPAGMVCQWCEKVSKCMSKRETCGESLSSGAQCGDTKTVCPAKSDCCESKYSPSHYGCTVDIGPDLWSQSQGCGDGLPSDGKRNTTLCCKPGPGLPPAATRKNVLIIGDSVSIGYTTLASKNVVKLLASTALVQHGPWDVSDGGAGDTATGVACLDRWLMTQSQASVKWDLITFNFGLHDLNNSTHCLGLYRNQLSNITARLSALGTRLLYVSTTPFMPLRTQDNTVVEDMNGIASKVVKGHTSGPIVDLYTTVTAKCGAVYTDCSICRAHPCSYHYNDEGMNAQAAVVAAAIKAALGL